MPLTGIVIRLGILINREIKFQRIFKLVYIVVIRHQINHLAIKTAITADVTLFIHKMS